MVQIMTWRRTETKDVLFSIGPHGKRLHWKFNRKFRCFHSRNCFKKGLNVVIQDNQWTDPSRNISNSNDMQLVYYRCFEEPNATPYNYMVLPNVNPWSFAFPYSNIYSPRELALAWQNIFSNAYLLWSWAFLWKMLWKGFVLHLMHRNIIWILMAQYWRSYICAWV